MLLDREAEAAIVLQETEESGSRLHEASEESPSAQRWENAE